MAVGVRGCLGGAPQLKGPRTTGSGLTGQAAAGSRGQSKLRGVSPRISRARGARRAPSGALIPREAARLGGPGDRRAPSAERARCARGTLTPPDWQLRLCTFGTRRAAARALPPATPVTGWPPSHPPIAPTQDRPSSRRSILEPRKVTVKGALRASHVMPFGHPGPQPRPARSAPIGSIGQV
jgi:hypothetical protein